MSAVIKFLLGLVVVVHMFVALEATADTVDLTKTSQAELKSTIELLRAKKPGVGTSKANCHALHCSGLSPLDGSHAACSDWCQCIHETVNSKAKCDAEYTDTTGKPAPAKAEAGDSEVEECTPCSLNRLKTKTCFIKDAYGSGDHATVTVDCNASLPRAKCEDCSVAFTFERSYCVGDACESKSCNPVKTFKAKDLRE